jgi:two-component system, sensor histidine kinase
MSPAASSGRSILIIEDNADARDALRVLLELEGHAVEAAGDGQEALELARTKDPDIALVRARDARRPVLIALTGYGQPEDRRRATEAGFDEMLVKPVDPTALTELLATLEIPGRGSRG